MTKFARRLPSPAMVVALTALFVAMGGTGYAASQLSQSDRAQAAKPKPKSKPKPTPDTAADTALIKRLAPRLSVAFAANAGYATNAGHATTAGTANTANTANTASTAANSSSVDGMQLSSFTYAAANGSTKSVLLNDFDGLTLKASCTSGNSDSDGLTAYADTATTGATIAWSDITENGPPEGLAKNDAYESMTAGSDYELMSPGGTVDSGNGSSGIGFSAGQIVYSVPSTGARVTITWSYANNIAGNACYFTGTAVGAPSGVNASLRTNRSSRAVSGSTLSDAELLRARG